MTDTSGGPSPTEQKSATPLAATPPEAQLKPETKPTQVSAPARGQRIWRGITIVSLILSLGATFGITARELFLVEPILEHPPIDQNAPFAQPFGVRNGMSFFTMHDTYVVTII
jgi:hypothetical protein